MATVKQLMDAGIVVTVDQAEDNYHRWLAEKEGRVCLECGKGNGYHSDECVTRKPTHAECGFPELEGCSTDYERAAAMTKAHKDGGKTL